MNIANVNLHRHYNKLINLHNYTLTDVDPLWAKMYKFYTFFLLYIH